MSGDQNSNRVDFNDIIRTEVTKVVQDTETVWRCIV
jgi:hypothetical protein